MQAPDSLPAPPPRPRLAAHWQFLLLAAGLYVLWLIVYEGFGRQDGRLDNWLSAGLTSSSAWLLRVLGFAGSVSPERDTVVCIDGRLAVSVMADCDGLALYALFAGFVVAFPGSWRPKLWFIPAGIAAIFVLNVARVAGLALNHHYAHQSVEFNHHYTFTFVVYAFIGALWVWWARHYGPPRPALATGHE